MICLLHCDRQMVSLITFQGLSSILNPLFAFDWKDLWCVPYEYKHLSNFASWFAGWSFASFFINQSIFCLSLFFIFASLCSFLVSYLRSFHFCHCCHSNCTVLVSPVLLPRMWTNIFFFSWTMPLISYQIVSGRGWVPVKCLLSCYVCVKECGSCVKSREHQQ